MTTTTDAPTVTPLSEEVEAMAALVCPGCGAYSQFMNRYPGAAFPGEHPVALQCVNCDMVIGGRENGPALLDHWPKKLGTKSFPDVPPGIAEAASEAHTCMSAGAFRAALAMARAVVQGTAKHFKIKGDLYQAIDKLVDAGHLTKRQGEVAHEIRLWGNDAAHGDLSDEVDPAEAKEVVDFMDEVLYSAFQQEARLLRIRDSRQSRTNGQ